MLGTIEAYHIRSLLQDWGHRASVTLRVDSSAALGFARREGLGRAKHIDLHWLWIQQEGRSGRLAMAKVEGKHNAADLMTKPLDASTIRAHLWRLSMAVA